MQVSRPSQIQLIFSLRNENNQAVVVPARDVQAGMRIFEQPKGAGPVEIEDALSELISGDSTGAPPADGEEDGRDRRSEGWEEIDYSETSLFVRTAENFEVMFALDFTDSMAKAKLADGRSGIDVLRDALRTTVAQLPVANRVGAVEFHDRNAEPTLLSEPTTNWISVLAAVDKFAESDFDPGSSRLWDALASVIRSLSETPEDPDLIKAVVFISDGRDTSSNVSRGIIGEMASANGIQLYALGLGSVFDEKRLADMVRATGGAYYPVETLDDLEDQLQQLIVDLLRGQYKLSYITLRSRGEYLVGIDVTLRGVTAEFDTPERIDVEEFFAPDTEGQIAFDPPVFNRARALSSVFVRASHVPRNVNLFRFKVDSSRPVEVRLATIDEGGLLGGWDLSGPDAEGFFEASSDEVLVFGNFGLLFHITVPRLFEDVLDLPIVFDNSVYTPGKRFAHPSVMSFGNPAPK